LEDDPSLHTLSTPIFDLYSDLRRELQEDEQLCALRDSIVEERSHPWQVVDGLILHGRRIYLPATSVALHTALQLAHTTGHEGMQRTLQHLRADFFIDNDRRLVHEFVRSCVTCQRNKTDALHPAGLLQPLEVPFRVWEESLLTSLKACPRFMARV
jgi:hypothetical protein